MGWPWVALVGHLLCRAEVAGQQVGSGGTPQTSPLDSKQTLRPGLCSTILRVEVAVHLLTGSSGLRWPVLVSRMMRVGLLPKLSWLSNLSIKHTIFCFFTPDYSFFYFETFTLLLHSRSKNMSSWNKLRGCLNIMFNIEFFKIEFQNHFLKN